MMAGGLLKSWKAVKQHVPLIKFRKGGQFRENMPLASAAVTTETKSDKTVKAQQSSLIEDWQLPPQYRRSTLDEKEIDAINSGGAY